MEKLMEETVTGEYPLDTDSLVKGSHIPAEVIELAFNVRRDTGAYQIAFMRAANYIQRRFLDRGETITITQRRFDLIILTDEEVPAHNERLFRNEIRKAARTHARSSAADRSQMSEATAKFHDRTLVVQGTTLAAISRVTREIKAATRTRATPALLRGVRSG